MKSHPLSRENLPRIQAGQEFTAGGKTYVMRGKLGDGAIGVVRNIIEKESQTQRVIKLLAPESKYIENSSMDDISARFKREGERGKELYHENLIEIYAYEQNSDGSNFLKETDTDTVPESPFIIMEHAGRRTLENYIRKDKGIPKKSFNFSKEALFIASEITKGVLYLHRRRLIHRDIKPANIFLTKRGPLTVKLGDFGIVKWSDFKATLTTGTLTVTGRSGLGTLKYMPPEQSINPKDVTVRSDMWTLGITLFELFTNQILPNYHYVYQLREVRMERSTLYGRMYKLGLGTIPPAYAEYELILEEILNSLLKESSRPSSRRLANILGRAYQSRLRNGES